MTSTNYDFNAMFTKLSRMPKAKALEVIRTEFPGYEATEVYTVRDNLTAAIEYAEAQLAAAEAAAVETIEPEATDTDATRQGKIDGLLFLLGRTNVKAEKKNIRSKLRRLGYRLSDQPKTDAE